MAARFGAGAAAGRRAGAAVPDIDMPGMCMPACPPAPDVRARVVEGDGRAGRPALAPLRRGWSLPAGIAIAPSSVDTCAIIVMWSAIMRM